MVNEAIKVLRQEYRVNQVKGTIYSMLRQRGLAPIIGFTDGAVAMILRQYLPDEKIYSHDAPAIALSAVRCGKREAETEDVEPCLLAEARRADANLWDVLSNYCRKNPLDGYLNDQQLPRERFLTRNDQRTPGERSLSRLVDREDVKETFLGFRIPFRILPLQAPGEVVAYSLCDFINNFQDEPRQVVSQEGSAYRIHNEGGDPLSPNFRLSDYHFRFDSLKGVNVFKGPTNSLSREYLGIFIAELTQ